VGEVARIPIGEAVLVAKGGFTASFSRDIPEDMKYSIMDLYGGSEHADHELIEMFDSPESESP